MPERVRGIGTDYQCKGLVSSDGTAGGEFGWPGFQMAVRLLVPACQGSCLLSRRLGGVSVVAPAAKPALEVHHLQE